MRRIGCPFDLRTASGGLREMKATSSGDPSHHVDQEGEIGVYRGMFQGSENSRSKMRNSGASSHVDVMMRPDRDPLTGTPMGDGGGYQGSGLEWDTDKGPKKEKVSTLFFFVTSWILFLQGISGMSGLAVSYFYKDTLMAEPATLSMIESMSSIPWTIKPLYGFLSDGWPIMGYRRRPYLIIAGVVGFISWVVMATIVNDIWFGASMMFLSSMALAVSNVIAEGMIVEKSRGESQEYASHLQAIVHGAQAVGGIIAAYFGGAILAYLADRHVFMLVSFFPLSLIVVAMINPERRFAGDVTSIRQDMSGKLKELWDTFQNPAIFRPTMFIFLLNATPATGSVWFYFYTDVLHFSSTFMGTINVVGAVFSLAGVVLFGKYLAAMPFRPILIWSTIISTIFGLSQLLLVFRLNQGMGIPDGFFCLGESAILSVLGWINTMPVLVLAARLCPEGMEATMYALIMSISNLGGVVGSQLGAGITWGLGVTEKDLTNFWILVLICNATTVLPLVFIGWIPDDDKDYGVEIDKQKAREREAFEGEGVVSGRV